LGALCMVLVQGKVPFLKVWPVVIDLDSMDWYRKERYANSIDEKVEWRFVSRIDIPQEVTA
jgi:hypothetical protein